MLRVLHNILKYFLSFSSIRMCCFTPGAFINNRSMMPCQEPPVAMSTWQATITLPNGTTALSSGDVAGEKEAVLRKLSSKQDKGAKLVLAYLFKCQPHKMVKHIQTIRRQNPTNCFECV